MLRSIYKRGIRDLRRAINEPMQTWPINAIGGADGNRVATPLFDPVAGSYGTTQNVTITCATPSSTIYYTTDGSAPTTGSSVYSSPIAISTTTTLRAFATAAGLTDSAIRTGVYSIVTADAYLLETGDYFLLESGDFMLLE